VDSAQESGAAGTSLVLGKNRESHTWIRPELGMGVKYRFESGARMNLHASVGLHRYLDESETDVIAGFAGAPAGVSPMHVAIGLDKSYMDGSFGANLITSDKVSLDMQYTTAIFKNRYDLDRWSFTLSGSF